MFDGDPYHSHNDPRSVENFSRDRPPQFNASNIVQDVNRGSDDGSDGDANYTFCNANHGVRGHCGFDARDDSDPRYDPRHIAPTVRTLGTWATDSSILRDDFGEALRTTFVEGGQQPPPPHAPWQSLDMLPIRERQLPPHNPGDCESWADTAAPTYVQHMVKTPSPPSSLDVGRGSKGSTSTKQSKPKAGNSPGTEVQPPKSSRPDNMTSFGGALFNNVSNDHKHYAPELDDDDLMMT